VNKDFGEVRILHGIDLQIRDGEFMVFVGPSGCGKSTLLRVIAGLEDISAGELRIGGRVVNDVPPAERGIAMVFQSYALYPHMSLYDNMAFGLKLAKVPKAEIDREVQNAAKLLHIEHLLQRKPKDLSGGQRQRVAIGARSCASRRSSCSTSRCPTSTRRCACACATSSPSCTRT
jgi:multiple sugar transport system ATP-binding protein